MTTIAATAPAHPLLSRAYRARLLGILLLTNTLSFSDRAIMSVVIEPMRHELGLSDGQLGFLQGLAFAITYSLMGLPVGRLAERRSRVWLIAGMVLIFSAGTGLSGIATTFTQLFLCRIAVGAGEGGFMAPATSLVADHFAPGRRASALAVLLCGSPLGFLFGAALGGQIAEHLGWRAAVMAMGGPGIVIAILLVLTLHEPPRGLAEGGLARETAPPPSLSTVLRHLFAQPAFRNTLAGAILCTMGATAIGQFQLTFFVRVYRLGLAHAGLATGVISAISLAPGMLIGGSLVDAIKRRDERWYLWLPALGASLGACFYAIGFLQSSLMATVPFIVVGGILLFFHYPTCYAIVQLIAGIRMRASAVAIYGMGIGLLGSGLGPTIAGLVSGRVAASRFAGGDYAALCAGGRGVVTSAACQAAAADGMRAAMLAGTVFMLWGALHFLAGARSLPRALAAGRAA